MYPPQHHLEPELKKIYRVIVAYPFATVISRTEDDVIVTQLPLVLERNRSQRGTLIGHLDKNNPHIKYLNNKNISVIFHGPNAYISPNVYESSQLPTWNSISVHIKGRVSITQCNHEVANSIIKMTSLLEHKDTPFVLDKNNQKMAASINYIVGFNIEITELVGRFKLSQDKKAVDTELAKQHLIQQSNDASEELINFVI